MSPQDALADLRAQIDRIDREIVERLNARAKLALAIGEQKKTGGRAVFDPAREREVLAKALAASTGPFPEKTLAFVYREIMAACRGLEEPVRVAYLGPEATFSHAAALRRFGSAAALLPQANFNDIFHEVERGNAAYGVVPIENTIEGQVGSTLDLFPESDLLVVGEVYLEVSQNLLAKDSDIANVRTVYSHPQPLAQCRDWLRKNLPAARLESLASTAEAAKRAASEEGAAAIGSLEAAELYGMRVLARSIEDSPNNVTRFFVVGREPLPVSGDPKTSLLLTLNDEPGVLFRVLSPLAESRVNMTKIESRPLKRRPWEYRFYVDLDGAPDREPLKGVLAKMRTGCTELRILGVYEKAPRPGMTARAI